MRHQRATVLQVSVPNTNKRILEQLGVFIICLLVTALGGCTEDVPEQTPNRTCPIECPFDCDPFTYECFQSDPVTDGTSQDGQSTIDFAEETTMDFGDHGQTDGVLDQVLNDGQTDPTEPIDDGVEPDDDVVPINHCPDALEEHTIGDDVFADNNDIERATALTDSLLLGELNSCGTDAFGSCDGSCDTSACDSGSPSGCNCCDCHLQNRLAACGNDDIDFYSFDLLKGDTATILVIPEEDAAPRDLFIRLINPDSTERSVGPTVDHPDENVVVIGGADNVIGDPRIIVPYHLSVRSATGDTVLYRIIVQIDADSRGCPADAWDAQWNNYLEDVGSERECTHAQCTVGPSTVGPPANLDAAQGYLCPWDATDVVKHVVDVADSSREVHIRWTSSMTGFSGILYRVPPSGTREEIGRLCEPGSDVACDGTTASARSMKRRFNDLRTGTYQLVITTDNLTEARDYSVLFYE